VPQRLLSLSYNTAKPAAGAARAILARRKLFGRSLPLSGVADFNVQPGMPAKVTTEAGGTPMPVDVSAVTWTMPDATMDITTRDVVAVPANAWLQALPGQSWWTCQRAPAGHLRAPARTSTRPPAGSRPASVPRGTLCPLGSRGPPTPQPERTRTWPTGTWRQRRAGDRSGIEGHPAGVRRHQPAGRLGGAAHRWCVGGGGRPGVVSPRQARAARMRAP
jgi:hypothetical protein